MSNKLILKVSMSFNTTKAKLWDALTNPDQIKKYMFGTQTTSDWKKGSPITFSGEWEGKSYVDKGTILEIEKERILRYNYWSSFSGTKDEPANYSNIIYQLEDQGKEVLFTITQDNFATPEAKDHSEKNWNMILGTMKDIVEN